MVTGGVVAELLNHRLIALNPPGSRTERPNFCTTTAKGYLVFNNYFFHSMTLRTGMVPRPKRCGANPVRLCWEWMACPKVVPHLSSEGNS